MNIGQLCKEKEQELLDKYFGNLINEAAKDCPETIGGYTKDMPLKIEAERDRRDGSLICLSESQSPCDLPIFFRKSKCNL